MGQETDSSLQQNRTAIATTTLHLTLAIFSPLWATLPSEMVAEILGWLVQRWSDVWTYSKYDKTGLASASVVCRYWEEETRRLLWSRLELRGPEDVDELLRIVRSRPELGFITMKIVYRKLDHRVPPWIRLRTLLTHFTPLRSSRCIFDVEVGPIHDSDPPGTMNGCTLLRCLPRTLPPSAMPKVANFHVASTFFRCARDILSIIHAFPTCLNGMHFEDSQFDRSYVGQTIVPPRYSAHSTPIVTLSYNARRSGGLQAVFSEDTLKILFIQRLLHSSDDMRQFFKDILCPLSSKSDQVVLFSHLWGNRGPQDARSEAGECP